jgi:hypothetical protein
MAPQMTGRTIGPQALLAVLWIFLTLNYIYCDVFSHSNPDDLKMILNGGTADLAITPTFLLAFAIVMELPMVMILLSLLLPIRVNRLVNTALPVLLVAIQFWSLFGTGTSPTPHYVFFSAIEITTNIAIVILAWTRLKPDQHSEALLNPLPGSPLLSQSSPTGDRVAP